MLIACAVAEVRVAAAAAPPCWERLLADWSDGAVTGRYPVGCYREALRRLPEDVRLYSSATDDITRALAERLRPSRSVAAAGAVDASLGAMPAAGGGVPVAPLVLGGGLVAAGLAAGAGAAIWRKRHG